MQVFTLRSPDPLLIVEDFVSPEEQDALLSSLHAEDFARGTFIGATALASDAEVGARKLDLGVKSLDALALPPEHAFVRLFAERFYSPPMLEAYDAVGDQLFRVLRFLRRGRAQLSAYGDGGFYETHRDYALLTANLFLAHGDEARFRGGGLELNGRHYAFHPRTLLVFPGLYPHRVRPVEGVGPSFLARRFSFQYWPSFCNEHGL